MTELNVKLDVFEGPLDLLLHLIKTLEIDIYDIPITEITNQYMQYIASMQTLELDLAGEYLVMAATLMAIKSKMLLPKQELDIENEEEEGEDPRDALVAQLLEYRRYKYAATILKEKEADRSLYYTRAPLELDDFREAHPPLDTNQFTTIDLFMAFHAVLEKVKDRGPAERTILHDEMTVDDKITEIKETIKNLPQDKGITFAHFFDAHSRQEVVTTFMAMLELMKSGNIEVYQEEAYGEILIYRYLANEEKKQYE